MGEPYMPLYWGDYHRDTGHLTTAEHGAYLLLLGHYWCTGKPLPDRDDALARVVRARPSAWKKMRSAVAPFFKIEDGVWTHRRVEDELLRRLSWVSQKKRAGEISADKRKEKQGTEPTSVQRPFNDRSTDVPLHTKPEDQDQNQDQFNIFWSSYPRKVAKGAALKAWAKVQKEGIPPETLLAALQSQHLEDRETQFIPHPATWLNHRRWEDDPAAGIGGSNGHGTPSGRRAVSPGTEAALRAFGRIRSRYADPSGSGGGGASE